MGKTWNVRIDEQEYHIELTDNNRRVTVNGSELLLKNCKRKTGTIYAEYEIQLGLKTASLVLLGMGDAQLIIDNKDYETGEEYVPPKLPLWAYVFIILNICMFPLGLTGLVLGGAIGGAFIGVSIVFTMSISNNYKKSTAERIVWDIVVFVVLFAILFAGRIFFNSIHFY
ncbi:MAG: hypothetical protein K2K21_02750 [Lachnospiraceae bacterium]|nr:hypothetical protein [Lachnospiraceae bacterium]